MNNEQPERLSSRAKMEITHQAAIETISAQKTERDAKTARLRELRLAKEAEAQALKPIKQSAKSKIKTKT
jgi:hypothetical protein